MKNSITKFSLIITLSLFMSLMMAQQSFAQSWNLTGNAGTNGSTNFIGTTDNVGFKIRTKNVVRITVGSTGNVGIGTTSPTNRLSVSGNANFTGNVGIGTATPTSKLHVQGEVRCVNPGNGFVHTDGSVTLLTYLDAVGAWFGTESNHNLNFYTNNSAGPMMTINTLGAVGIGTPAPTTAKLVIAGSSGAQGLDLSSSNLTANMRVLQNTNSSLDKDMYFGFQSGPTSSLHLYSNNAETMTVANGKVGIGATSATGYLLTVGGKIICTELKVQVQPFPDYVFADNYNLKSIEEVEQHIKTYNRLPGMPTACDVEENGMNVGDMQTKVVEKVEENTLYIIQLKKEIDALKAELNSLKK